MNSDDGSGAPRSRKSVGDFFGDLARRVGEIVTEVSETVTISEAVRDALKQARGHRFAEEWTQARRVIVEARETHPDDAHLHGSLVLTHVHRWYVAPHLREDLELHKELCSDGEADDAACHLSDAAQLVLRKDPQRALDAIRRANRARSKSAAPERPELALLTQLWAAEAYAATGDRERAIRELYKARGSLPNEGAVLLRHRLTEHGANLLAAEDRLLEAERWVREAVRSRARARQAGEDQDEGSGSDEGADLTDADVSPTREPSIDLSEGPEPEFTDSELALLAHFAAARGDRAGADALLERLGDAENTSEARVKVHLLLSDTTQAVELSLRHLQREPTDPRRLRLWALAQANAWDERVEESAARGVIDALRVSSQAAPPRLAPAYAQEIASIALAADFLDAELLRPELSLAKQSHASPELALLAARVMLREGNPPASAFEAGPPIRWKDRPEVDHALGPDELSPLRDPRRRAVDAQRQLTVAEYCALVGRKEQARDALVQALVASPRLGRASRLMGDLSPHLSGTRLEDVLSSATALLSSVPSSVLGRPIPGVSDALASVIAARERLARPLTIAIMGEFSSGKSTFVNALLGEAVAPTGALPTTSTINVFRRGGAGRARVHYRDGSISTVARDEVFAFLEGLDATEAGRIRYTEIERTGDRLGDAAVVDTPGLNALDPYHERVAREFIDEADAVVWVFSATRGGAASEAAMLAELQQGGRSVLGVLNKVDTLEEGEQEELSAYLREQLGDVLVGVIPLSATRALAWRTDSDVRASAADEDPFAAVDTALEDRFLSRARELKRDLTTRRLREALGLAKGGIAEVISGLEESAASSTSTLDPGAAARSLDGFAGRIHERILGIDDLLVRECLATGLVAVDRGFSPDAVDRRDIEYLDSVLAEASLRALAEARTEIPDAHLRLVGGLVGQRFTPWAKGYLAARTDAQPEYDLRNGRPLEEAARSGSFMAEIIMASGSTIEDGEAALRGAFRGGLRRIADDWRRALRGLHRDLEAAGHLAAQRTKSAPRAEALRLRTGALAGIEQLEQHLES